ncbi:hypothetical protein [Noviherbaspirillum autotrophicum]|uniref:Uncharacterized protein n=1 Tax=Noviherbaspirillum autotrophicum TaxID=709839 RepID=A0A0C2BQV5_9BURK|nr:hypothetical protein [Noviherbaspirillum autotrophicum]KIF80416.1 hypothetical protein TSA66_05630 [Noviherbaspirillum autotrophicum]
MRTAFVLTILALATASALAKLPPPTPEAAAAAAAAKDKAAWSDKVAAYKLCLAQDRVAKQYLKSKEGARKPTMETPACTDPGPYVPSAAAAGAPNAANTPAPPAASGVPAAAAATPPKQ